MSETKEHMEIKRLVSGRLKDWFGCSIQEFPESGHELDVYAITNKGIKIYVEVIWSPTRSHFLSDLLSIEHASTHVKLAIVNPKILENDEFVRKFHKTAASQLDLGIKIHADMLNAKLFLENAEFLDSEFKEIVMCLVQNASADNSGPLFEKRTPLAIKDRAFDESLNKYLNDLIFQYENFSNSGKPVLDQLAKFNFTRHYVSVLVRDLINGFSSKPEDLVGRWLKDKFNGLFIIGDFGTGKSTLCVHLAYLLARVHVRDKESRIPIFISLRDVDEISKESILVETNKLFRVSWDQLEQYSANGKLVFLLDGFDEIPERTDWKKTLNDFNGIVNLFCKGKSKVIVSCRTHFFKKDSEIWGEDTELMKSLRASKDFSIVSTVPFKKDQIIEFIKKHTENWEKVWSKIQETYNLEELSSRPLLIEMIVSTLSKIVSIGGSINEAMLYDKYTEDWINRDDWRSSLKPFQKARLMERLAFKLFCQEKYFIQFSEIKQIIENEFGVKEESVLADYYDYDIRTCSFFRRDSDGNYSFMHKSFLEFFVAKKIAGDINKSTFIDLGKKLFTNEIIFFLCKLLNQHVETIESTLIEAVKYTKKRSLAEFGSMGGNALKILDKLEKANFINEDFSLCCIQGANITCDFQHCNLSGLKVKDCEFESTKFVDCSLSEIEFFSVTFDNCYIKLGNLNKGILTDTIFKSTEVNDLFLLNTKFNNCTFKNLKLINCDLNKSLFTACKSDFINYASLNFIQSKLYDCQFDNSELRCAIFSNLQGNNIKFSGCDLSGSCFLSCSFGNFVFENGFLAFSSFIHFNNGSNNFTNTRLYKIYSDDFNKLKATGSLFKASIDTNHEIYRSSIKPNPHIPVLCELDKAVRHFAVDIKTEEKAIDNYGLFWEKLKTNGKSAAMATAFYAVLKSTGYPKSLNEIAEQFFTNRRSISANYRRLLISGYVSHVNVSPKQLIESYAKELKISRESKLLAKGIFDSAKKNRLPQGRDSATYATACLYLACKKNHENITAKSLSTVAKLSTTTIRNGRETIAKYCNDLLV